MTHFQKWLATMLEGLDKELAPKTREKILENCGRACLSASFVRKVERIRRSAENEEVFLQKLRKQWKHFHEDDGQFYVIYDRCYCPMVKDYSGELSSSFCHCSRGWIEELFETVLQRPVEVGLETSIKRGDERCSFRVYI
jgi:predicted hydrocarbon binding protein